jgi:hypothetical protein
MASPEIHRIFHDMKRAFGSRSQDLQKEKGRSLRACLLSDDCRLIATRRPALALADTTRRDPSLMTRPQATAHSAPRTRT